MTKSGITEAYERFEVEQYGRKEKRCRLHVDRVAAAIIPHLLGKWTIVNPRQDDCEDGKPVHHVTLHRADGLLLSMYATRGNSSPYGVTECIHIGAGRYELPNGEYVDPRYMLNRPYGQRPASAVVNVTKRDAKAIAKDIQRRVIEPLSPLAAAFAQRVSDYNAATSQRDNVKAQAIKLGIALREHYNDKNRLHGTIPGGPSIEIGHGGSIKVEAFHCDAATLAKLVKIFAK